MASTASWRRFLWAVPLLLAAQPKGEAPVWKPFELDHKAPRGGPADVRFLLDPPAGKHGFLTVKDGRLVFEDGTRFRIWGVNLSFSGNLPEKQDAAQYADLLARFGINCIRVHHCDRAWPRGLIDDSQGNTRKLHPEALDRFDYFVNELKKRGIYVDLNLNVSRQFLPGDGVKDVDKIGYGKGLTYFDPVLIELQKEYARQLLTHLNPYTGTEYRHEPAVAIVEMVNENSLIESWVAGRLRGRQTEPTRATWSDIPPSYAEDLTRLFNDWLRRERPGLYEKWLRQAGLEPKEFLDENRSQGPSGVEKPVWQARMGQGGLLFRLEPELFLNASPERFRTEAEFYMSLERRFFLEMRRFLKEELGVRALLIGTSAHSRTLAPYALLSSTSLLDIVDGHTYWQHPSYKREPGSDKVLSWRIANTPMVDDPLHSTVQALARNAVLGKPYTVSEINHPYPSEYAAEGIPIIAAYGALQDWDGIFWYSFSHIPPHQWKPGPAGFFDIRNDPVKMTQLPVGALIFLRGDVNSARRLIQRFYTREEIVEFLRKPPEAPWLDPRVSPLVPLVHRTRIASFDGEGWPYDVPATSPIRSDTGELAWYFGPSRGSGLVVIDTPRSQALIGFVAAHPNVRTANLTARVQTPFCAITLQALDGKPIRASRRLLLTTGARVAATGMKWNEDRTTLVEEGTAPMQIEAVVGELELSGLEGARRLRISPLDGAGRPVRARTVSVREGRATVELQKDEATPWYVVEVE